MKKSNNLLHACRARKIALNARQGLRPCDRSAGLEELARCRLRSCSYGAQSRPARQLIDRALVSIHKANGLWQEASQRVLKIVEMRTAKHNRRVVDEIVFSERIPKIFLDARGGKLPALGELHEAWQREQIDKVMRVMRRDKTAQLIAMDCDRRCRHKHAPRTALLKRLFHSRLHADDRYLVEPPHLIYRNRGRRIARDDDGIRPLPFDEETECLAHIATHGRHGLCSVGNVITVGKGGDVPANERRCGEVL